MGKNRLLVVLVAVIGFAATLHAGVGEISYMDGLVELNRDGELFDEYDLDVGTEVENYDQITTGTDGEMIVDLTTKRTAEAELHISPNTTFSIELNEISGKEQTTFSLMAGSLRSKVSRLSGSQSFEIRTESVALGVRGTDFFVQTSPGGDLLVTVEEGKVSCFDEEEQTELFAEPGTVVEKRPGELFQAIPVAVSDIESFRREWLAERISVFKTNALRVIRSYAVRYDRLLDSFNSEYEALIANRDILNKWYDEDRDGRIGSLIQRIREKREIIGHLFDLRKTLFIFERIYFRLLELQSYFEEGHGRGQVRPGQSATSFFRTFEIQRRELAKRMSRVRYIVKLYAKRNDDSFPLSF
jgi:hypothetical protein